MREHSTRALPKFGGDPKVDLLPPELRIMRTAQKVQRRLVYGIALLALSIFMGSFLVRAQANQALANLHIEQRLTQGLLLQQQEYRGVQKIQAKIALIQASQQVGDSTEINWEKYLKAVQITLPSNVIINTVNIDSETPFSTYSPPSGPILGERIATLNFTATSSTLPRVPDWLNALATLPGYADASPGTVTRGESGSYSVIINMHINESVFTNRYAGSGKKL